VSSLGGVTRNPYDLGRTPGGSSGGTAAAVSASRAAEGWGSDTRGSIRLPASHTALFGLRPTRGLSSTAGIIPLSHTQDMGGPLARTATDLAIALDATIGPDPDDEATQALQGRELPRFFASLDPAALRGSRLGILTNYSARDQLDPDVAEGPLWVSEGVPVHPSARNVYSPPHSDGKGASYRPVGDAVSAFRRHPTALNRPQRLPSTSAMKASVCSFTSSVTDMCPRSVKCTKR